MTEAASQLNLDECYLSKREASAYLRLCRRTIQSRLSEIPHYKIGGKVLFKRSELDSWMARYRKDPVDLDKIVDEVIAGL